MSDTSFRIVLVLRIVAFAFAVASGMAMIVGGVLLARRNQAEWEKRTRLIAAEVMRVRTVWWNRRRAEVTVLSPELGTRPIVVGRTYGFAPSVGSSVEIRFDPMNPTVVAPEGINPRSAQACMLVIGGAALSLWGFVSLVGG